MQRSIVWYAPGMKAFNPSHLSKGIGGSETSIIELSKHFQRRGFQVEVWCNCDAPGSYDGVKYFHSENFNLRRKYEILVLWRWQGLGIINSFTADYVILDVHDYAGHPHIHADFKRTQSDVDAQVNKVVVKSKFQFDSLPKYLKPKAIIIQNGVADAIGKYRFQVPSIHKNPHKIVWTSCYTRGLEYFIKGIFPKLRAVIPELELHVFYGMDLLDLADQLKFQELFQCIEGIVHHESVGRDELFKHLLSASFHYYVSDFPEIDCISVKESALAGCITITNNSSALCEKDYIIKLNFGRAESGSVYSEKNQEKITNFLLQVFRNPELCVHLRETMEGGRGLQQIQTWCEVGDEWIKLL